MQKHEIKVMHRNLGFNLGDWSGFNYGDGVYNAASLLFGQYNSDYYTTGSYDNVSSDWMSNYL